MKKIILIAMISLFLVGCQTNTRAKIVKVPIVICPVPEHMPEPAYAIDALTDDDKTNWEKIAKSYAATVVRCQADNKALREQLEVYRSGNGEITTIFSGDGEINGTTDK